MRTSRKLIVPAADRTELERLVRGRNTPQKTVLRARIVLLSGAGASTGEIMEELGTTTPTITRWRDRYVAAGVAGAVRGAWGAAGAEAEPQRGDGGRGRGADIAGEARGRHPLEHAEHGGRRRHQRHQRPAHLESARAAAAPGRNLQALPRSAVRREAP